MYNVNTTVDSGKGKPLQRLLGGPVSARTHMKKTQARMGRPSRYEGCMSSQQFDETVAGLGDKRVAEEHVAAARSVMVDGVSTASLAAELKISRQYLHRVIVMLWDRSQGFEEVSERLPAKAALMVRELAAACREGGDDIEKRLAEIQHMTSQLKVDKQLGKIQRLTDELHNLAAEVSGKKTLN